jgi:hypothetical protein
MAALLSYAPVAEFISGSGDYISEAHNLGRDLEEKEIPACIIRRPSAGDLDSAVKIAAQLAGCKVLPVVEIHPGDTTAPLRNLAETCVSGILVLKWTDGNPDFDHDKMLDILNATGRFRLALDLIFSFEGSAPEFGGFRSLIDEMTPFTKKYGHSQVVKFDNIACDAAHDTSGDAWPEMLKILSMACPWALAAVSPSIWVECSSLRIVASDLGLVIIEPGVSQVEKQFPVDLKGADKIASDMSLPLAPRLPLIPRFYRKGWYSFEIGKILDYWTGRNIFRAYRDRPGWLED